MAQTGLVTMRTFLAILRLDTRLSPWHRSAAGPLSRTATRARARLAAVQAGSEAGFMLLEVVISALLVGLIAVGTLGGFDSAGRARADERAHAQATQLVEQDEDRLRGLTTTQLAQLGTAEPRYEAENGMCLEKISSTYSYWNQASTSFCEKTAPFAGTTYTGVVFSVTSSAEFASAEKELKAALQLDKNNLVYWKDLRTTYYLGGNFPATLSVQDLIAKVETPGAGEWFIRALCYDKLNQPKPALEAYEKFLELDQDKNPDQVWQAQQRSKVLRRMLDQKR